MLLQHPSGAFATIIAVSFIACGGGSTAPTMPATPSIISTASTTTVPPSTPLDCRTDNIGSLTLINDSDDSNLMIVVQEGYTFDLGNPIANPHVNSGARLTIALPEGAYSVLWVGGQTIYRHMITLITCTGITIHVGIVPQSDPYALQSAKGEIRVCPFL